MRKAGGRRDEADLWNPASGRARSHAERAQYRCRIVAQSRRWPTFLSQRSWSKSDSSRRASAFARGVCLRRIPCDPEPDIVDQRF